MSIEVRNLTKHFGDFIALDDVASGSRPASWSHCLVFGLGKTTLLRIISGLEVRGLRPACTFTARTPPLSACATGRLASCSSIMRCSAT